MTIAEFLEARIAEDEQLARDAIADDMGQDGGFEGAYDKLTKPVPGGFLPRFGEAAARMIVWNTPRRMLAECAAKREIVEGVLDLERDRHAMLFDPWAFATYKHSMQWFIRPFAAVYKDHPDYQQEWEL